MPRRSRILIVIVVLGLALAGGWAWLHHLALSSPHATAASASVIGRVFGGAMALLLALSPFLYLLARRNDQMAANSKREAGQSQEFSRR